jgi:uncharacterized protein YydD (DUF2326 family)
LAKKQMIGVRAKLSKADGDIQAFVRELVSRNEELQRHVVKLEADIVERDNHIKALKPSRRQ